MSGWIKLEKDLLTDPRVIRMGTKLCNDTALHGVTVVLGGLAHLWMLADTHIGLDDVIPLGTDEINHVIGIQGFCELLPQDWFQIIDSDHVKLPGFHAHNGTIAKERAQTAKRVQKHRFNSNARPLRQRNARPLLDQDLDQDQESKKNPFPLLHDSLPKKEWEEWLAWRKGKRMPCDSLTMTKQLSILVKLSTGDQIATIEKSIQAGWQGLFPEKTLNGKHAPAPNHEAAWAEARSRAKAIGFRDPHPQESPGAYMTDIKMAESSPRSGPHSIAALAQKMRMPA